MDVLKLENVSLTYHSMQGETKALQNINFSVKENEFVAIVGPSGCGKTTILNMIAGILKPTDGNIFILGEDLYINSKKLNHNKNIGYMFQRDHLFEWRTIWKNVTLGIELNKNLSKLEKLEKENYINELLKKYGLIDFKNKKPRELSGGMRQRVALIRTLALNPKLLLLDEPFSALDYQTRLNVCDDVSNIISSENKTAILVTHDISEAISLADKVIILTKRPATIKDVVEINLKSLGTPLKRRESPIFSSLFEKIYGELKNEKS